MVLVSRPRLRGHEMAVKRLLYHGTHSPHVNTCINVPTSQIFVVVPSGHGCLLTPTTVFIVPGLGSYQRKAQLCSERGCGVLNTYHSHSWLVLFDHTTHRNKLRLSLLAGSKYSRVYIIVRVDVKLSITWYPFLCRDNLGFWRWRMDVFT